MAWNYEKINQYGLEDIDIGVAIIPAGPGEFFQNKLTLSYTQPLLQNFKGTLDRLGYDMGQYAVEIDKVQKLESEEDFLLSMGLQFIDWSLLTEQKKIAFERLELAKKQLEQIEKKRAANMVDEVDVLRANDAVHFAQQGTVMINALWLGKRMELATLLQSTDLLSSSPDFDVYTRYELEDSEKLISRLRKQSRVLSIFRTQSAQLDRQESAAHEMTKAQLYLVTQFGVLDGAETAGDAFGFDNKDVGVFMQYKYPLGNTRARRDHEVTQLQTRTLKYASEEAALSLESAARNLLIQIQELEKAMDINKQLLESGRLKTEAELKRYNQGRSDLAFVIQSQDSEQSVQLSYAENAALYHSLNLQLKALLDEINPSPAQNERGN